MDRRMAQDLDNHITGHYGEDQFKGQDEDITHDFEGSTCQNCEDGPEVGIIRSILPTEADRLAFLPGREGWNLRVERRANRISQKLFGKQYRELSKDGSGERTAKVRRQLLIEGV
jgi:hypothetical protein